MILPTIKYHKHINLHALTAHVNLCTDPEISYFQTEAP